jgi:hypothetical protein
MVASDGNVNVTLVPTIVGVTVAVINVLVALCSISSVTGNPSNAISGWNDIEVLELLITIFNKT